MDERFPLRNDLHLVEIEPERASIGATASDMRVAPRMFFDDPTQIGRRHAVEPLILEFQEQLRLA